MASPVQAQVQQEQPKISTARILQELGYKLMQLATAEDALAQSRAEAQFLRNQLNAAQAKISELELKLKPAEESDAAVQEA